MKKKYVKPELLYEQYMLNQHMAATCVVEFQGKAEEIHCKAVGNSMYNMEGLTLFLSPGVCGTTMKSMENYCYYPSVNTRDTIGLYGSTL